MILKVPSPITRMLSSKTNIVFVFVEDVLKYFQNLEITFDIKKPQHCIVLYMLSLGLSLTPQQFSAVVDVFGINSETEPFRD